MLLRAGSNTLKISTSQITKLTGESASATHTTTFLSVYVPEGIFIADKSGWFCNGGLTPAAPHPPSVEKFSSTKHYTLASIMFLKCL